MSNDQSKAIAAMQPMPTKTDVTHSDADAQTCYLWIHLVSGYDRVITFPSVKQAYVYAEQYVFENNAHSGEVTENTININDVVWTAADGVTWISPDTCWDTTLTKIYDDITADTLPKDKQWDILSTCCHQMVIGLGTDLSEDCADKYCTSGYTLEDHDKPEDMPPFLRTQSEPRFTGSAFYGDERRYGIDVAAPAILQQDQKQEQHQREDDYCHEFDYEQGRWCRESNHSRKLQDNDDYDDDYHGRGRWYGC
jgi:hypothetical protein